MSCVPASYQAVDPDGEPPVPVRLGRYELLGRLAIGGMAEIYLARLAGEAGFEKIVVVKRLLPELVASRTFVAMFLDEGKLVSRLDHPNICEVHELGRDGNEYFLAMPYLDGIAVSGLIARRDTDPRTRQRIAASIVVQACAGLHYAHELRDADGEPLGLVHRDVTPSNLFATTAGVIKVLDFGIAKVRGATTETEAGMVKGKAQYMAPEQLLGGAVDRRCDVFMLGIVLFELATGTRLFARDSDYLAARAILEEPIPRAEAIEPALAEVIAHALARDPIARPVDARAFAREIEAAVVGLGGIATPHEIAAALTEEHGEELGAQRTRQASVLAEARTLANSAMATRPRDLARRRPSWRGPAAVVGALGLVAAAYAIGHRSVTTTSTATIADAGSGPVAGSAVEAGSADVGSSVEEIAMPAEAARAPGRGQISIDATPWATITIDGRSIGVTPLLHVQLAAGKHRVHAAVSDGRTRDVTITIEAGRAAPPLVLR